MSAQVKTKKEQLEKLVKLFGGLEKMKAEFPETYNAYERSLKTLPNNQNFAPAFNAVGKAGSAAAQTNDFIDLSIRGIGYTDSTKSQIYLDYKLMPSNNSNEKVQIYSLKAVNRDNNRDISPEVSDMSFMGNLKENRLIISVADTPLKDIRLEPHFYEVSDQINSFYCDTRVGAYNLNASGDFDIIHPKRKKKERANKNINVEYHIKRGFSENDRDYFYSDDDIGGTYNTGYFTLENEGSIKVTGVQLSYISGIRLEYSVGEKFNTHPIPPNCYDIKNNTINWTIPKRADFLIKELIPYTAMTKVIYTLKIDARVAGSGEDVIFRLTNNPNIPESKQTEKLDPIVMYFDCLLKGTKITMTDGTQKAVETLKAGDKVKTGPSGTASIKEIGGSQNTIPVVTIKAENGSSADVSYSHTIVTDKGLRHSQLVQIGDVLYTPNGSATKAKSVNVSEPRQCELYFISLNCNNARLYINGIQAGDSLAEMTDDEKLTNERYTIPEKWRKDFDSWNAIKRQK